MREATKEERKSINNYIESISQKVITIPDGATNGDMIKAMFPNAKYAECKNVIAMHTEYFGVTHFDKEWWNSPYKKACNGEREK